MIDLSHSLHSVRDDILATSLTANSQQPTANSKQPASQRRIFAGESFQEETVLDFVWPSVTGSGSGQFYAAAMAPGTFNLMSDLDAVIFTW